jgi:hypothetical protein
MSEGAELVDAVRRVYDINRNVVAIDPEFLANHAMEILRFDKSIHPVGWLGCNLHMRQIARAFCRRNFDTAAAALAGEAVNGDLFPDTLQDRYPRQSQKGQEPVYVLREHLSEDDRWFNIDRLRSAALALQKHARALEIETEATFGPRKDRAA